MVARLLAILPFSAAVQFRPFEATEQYKCGSFLAEQVDDRAMAHFYSLINGFIRLLSRPLPHQDVLSRRALQGDFNDVKQSFVNKYPEWLAHEQWWLVLAGSLVLFSALFTVFYLLYSCCICCCYANEKKKKTTDSRHDACKRRFLNCCIAVFVVINIFSVAALLVSSQYAEYGADELPQRLSHCLDDLSLYKRDTDLKIRKLLIDDFQALNSSLVEAIATGGATLVQKVKKVTGAQAIDLLINVANTAQDIQKYAGEAQKEVKLLNDDLGKFRSDFAKLRKASTRDLLECVLNELEPAKSLCQRAEKMLNQMDNFPLLISSDIISKETEKGLQQIVSANISSLFVDTVENFEEIEKELQAEIDYKQYSAQSKLKQIGDDLFVIAETISTQIRQINFDVLYKLLNTYTDERNGYQEYVQYSWYASLFLSGIFALVALYFLFALCYGCCGRRPTFYEDDCCVRSTGSKLFKCGIWLAVFLLTFLSTVTAVLLLIGGNISNLICHPLQDPLSRPDMLSLSERLLEVWRSQRVQNGAASFYEDRTPADVIRACARNETLYQIFDLDKKYHLNDLREYERETYDQLEDYIRLIVSDVRITRPLNALLSPEKVKMLEALTNVTLAPLDDANLNAIRKEAGRLDLEEQINAFLSELEKSTMKSRAVSAVIERVRVIEASSARPLRERVQGLLESTAALREKLANISLPVSSVVVRLQHAQALLSADLHKHFEEAANDLTSSLKSSVDDYIEHLRSSMASDVTSCVPLTEVVRGSRAALCSHTVDPFNGVWASMLISILCSVPIIMMGTSVVRLYRKMHSFPKYVVHEPNVEGSQMCAFATDTYDTRNKQTVYSSAYGGYKEEFQPPYMRTRT